MDCKYCVYLEKYVLYPQVSKWAMQVEVLDGYIRQYNEAHNIRGYYGAGSIHLFGNDLGNANAPVHYSCFQHDLNSPVLPIFGGRFAELGKVVGVPNKLACR